MVNASRFIRIFLGDDRGATGAEYALLLAVVAGSLAMSAFMLGGTVTGSMDNSAGVIEKAGCSNNGQGTGLGGGNGGGGGQGGGNGAGNTC